MADDSENIIELNEASPDAENIDVKPSKTPKLDFDQAFEAIKAIQEYASNQSKSKSEDLFQHDRSVYLDVVMKKYPIHLPAVRFIQIALPHPFHDTQTASSCIFVRDMDKYPHKLADREKAVKAYRQYFEEKHKLTGFTQILSISQLMTEYKMYDDKRKLCDAYDVFVADKRLGGSINRKLGKHFISSKKVPFLINVKINAKKNFEHVFELTRAMITPSTLKFTVKIGRLNQPADHLLANLKAIRRSLTHDVPGKWTNVRSAYVSLPGCLDLPIYVDWGSSNSVKMPRPKPVTIGYSEGELTTLPGDDEHKSTIRVYDDGLVRIGKKGKKRQSDLAVWNPPKQERRVKPKKRKINNGKAKKVVKREVKEESDHT